MGRSCILVSERRRSGLNSAPNLVHNAADWDSPGEQPGQNTDSSASQQPGTIEHSTRVVSSAFQANEMPEKQSSQSRTLVLYRHKARPRGSLGSCFTSFLLQCVDKVRESHLEKLG